MKKLFLAIATVAMIFATSCKKENVNEPVNPEEIPANSFLCEIDNGAMPQNAPRINDGMGTMTTTNGTDIFWKNGDAIEVNGVTFTNSNADKTKAYFTNPSYATQGFHADEYYAFYPVGIDRDTTLKSGENPVHINLGTLPEAIPVEAANNAKYLPMFAYSNTDHWLTFRNICAVLELHLPVDCKAIRMSAAENICGDFRVLGYNTATPYAALNAKSGKDTVITLSGTFTTNSYVYVAIPAGTYHNVSFQMTGNDDVIYLSNKKSEMIVANNVVYPATLTGTPKTVDNIIPNDAFGFTATTAGDVTLSKTGTSDQVNCSFDYITIIGGTKGVWANYTVGTPISLSANDKVYFRAQNNQTRLAYGTGTYHKFSATGDVTVSGDVTYLLNKVKASATMGTYAFKYLFQGMTKLTDASGLTLPFITLSLGCYESLFDGCTNLETVFDSLPATTISSSVYKNMFRNCSTLTAAPSLPTTSALAWGVSSCEGMFQNCTTLTTTPTIAFTSNGNIGAGGAFKNMFAGCSSLITVNVILNSGVDIGHKTTVFDTWLPDKTGTINVTGTAVNTDFEDTSTRTTGSGTTLVTYSKVAYLMNRIKRCTNSKCTSYTDVTPNDWTIMLNTTTQISRISD